MTSVLILLAGFLGPGSNHSMRFVVILSLFCRWLAVLGQGPESRDNPHNGWYSFSDGSLANQGWEFGTGVLNGEPEMTEDRFGEPVRAYRFEGPQSFTIPDVDLTWPEGTISFWFRIDEFPQFAATLMSLSAPNGVMNVSVDRDILRPIWGIGGQGLHFGVPRVERGKWHHYSLSWTEFGNEFAVSFDGLYLRRNLLGDVSGRSFAGNLNFANESTFVGAMDDIEIWSHEWSRRQKARAAGIDLLTDSDSDGILDGVEVGNGLDPNKRDEVAQGIVETFPALELSIFTLKGIVYQLQESSNLVDWVDEDEAFEGIGGASSLFVRQTGEFDFYRLVGVP